MSGVGEASGAVSTSGSGPTPPAVGAPSWPSHVQFQVHAQVQSSAVALGLWSAIDVVSPQNVNDQIHVQGSLAGSLRAAGGAEPGSAGCDDVILRGPSGCEGSLEDAFDPPSSEESTASKTARGSAVSELTHVQFHVQSHTQTSDPGLPVSADDEFALPAQSISKLQTQCHD